MKFTFSAYEVECDNRKCGMTQVEITMDAAKSTATKHRVEKHHHCTIRAVVCEVDGRYGYIVPKTEVKP